MNRKVAFAFYGLGAMLALRSFVTGLANDHVLAWFTGAALGLAIWWIAVGFGVRLGTEPSEFVAAIKSILGFETSSEKGTSTGVVDSK